MYFDLTDDQKALRDQLQDMLADHLPENRIIASFEAAALDRPLWSKLVDMGLIGIAVPEAHGGHAMGLLTLAVVAEAMGEAAASAPVIFNAVAAWLLAEAGSDAQRERWLSALLEGRAIAAFALSMNDAGDVDRSERGGFSGEAKMVVWGADADLVIVELSDGSIALVDGADAGLSRRPVNAVDTSQPVVDLVFDDVAADGLGATAEQVGRLKDAILVMLAADAFGAGDRAVRMAADYAKIRTQFDRPIGSFQGLKHQLADMTAEILPCRFLVWYAAHAWDSIPEKSRHAAASAKAHVTDVAVNSARRAVEAHGGIGYTWEYPLHVFLKRAMFDRAAMGLPRAHRARAASLAGW